MSVDHSRLEEYRRFSDPSLGISEEFVRPTLSGAPTMGVLSTPLTQASELGFVVCPSFGPEHTQLSGLEVVVARRVAGSGFPVLRYHGSGYSDSEASKEATVASHLADAADAVADLCSRGVARVGLIGGLFGGTVALLSAERLEVDVLVLVEPVIEGRRYAERLLRSVVLSGVRPARDADGRPPLEIVRDDLSNAGVDLRGFRFTKPAYDELCAIDLRTGRSFGGGVLLVSASRSGLPSRATTALAGALTQAGASVQTRGVRDKLVHPLGAFRYAPRADRPGRVDTQFELNSSIADVAAEWVRRSAAPVGSP